MHNQDIECVYFRKDNYPVLIKASRSSIELLSGLKIHYVMDPESSEFMCFIYDEGYVFKNGILIDVPETYRMLKEDNQKSTISSSTDITNLRETIKAAVTDYLHSVEALFCTRHEEGWFYGTMKQSDFVHVADCEENMNELTDCIIKAISRQTKGDAWEIKK